MDTKRGPKIGDAASLWNFTPSPGWSREESLALKLCLMKFGVGQWVQIQAAGLLPGKLIQQLYGATQRLLGQQSLAAFSGLRVDVDRVRYDNEAKKDAQRKSGLIIWSGPNPTKEMKAQWQQEARDKYGLTPEQQREVEAAYSELLEQASAAAAQQPAAAVVSEALPPDLDLLQCDVASLSTRQKQLLLVALHARLARLAAAAVQQQPQLASLLTYQQQQPAGWIAQSLAAAGAAEQGDGSDAKENRPSGCANLVVRQAGTAAGRPAGKRHQGGSKKAGSSSSSSKLHSSKAGSGSGNSSSGKKRGRHKAGARGVGDEEEDAEDAFLRRGGAGSSRRRRGGGGCDTSAGGSSGLLADLMRAALEAGVAQLVDMGYSRSKALDALQECNCDVAAAVEYLTAACC